MWNKITSFHVVGHIPCRILSFMVVTISKVASGYRYTTNSTKQKLGTLVSTSRETAHEFFSMSHVWEYCKVCGLIVRYDNPLV